MQRLVSRGTLIIYSEIVAQEAQVIGSLRQQ
jgi:hypothetical protein